MKTRSLLLPVLSLLILGMVFIEACGTLSGGDEADLKAIVRTSYDLT